MDEKEIPEEDRYCSLLTQNTKLYNKDWCGMGVYAEGHILMVAKYAIGHGILRPECAVELAKA